MSSIRQASFAGGEISPSFYGRNDVEKWGTSLRLCRDFYPTPAGNVLNRPGTRYLGAVKDSTKKVRLVPFIYSDTDTYVLEFGNLYVRFWKNGLRLGGPYEVVTPYLEADLPYLKFAQVGDVLWLANKSYPLKKLTRLADTSWTFGDSPYSMGSSAASYFPDGQPAIYFDPAGFFPADVANGMAPREWIWQVTALVQDSTTGARYESLAATVTHRTLFGAYPWTYGTLPSTIAVFPKFTIEVAWDYTPGLFGPPGNILAWRVYRGRGKLFGFVGETTTTRFVDVGDEPDYGIQPPTGRVPFDVYNGAGSLVRTEEPSAVAFFEQRMALARTDERPDWLWLSALNNFYNFDVHGLVLEDDSVEIELASLRREEVRSLAALDRLFLFTSGGVWTVSGNGGPLTAYTMQAIKHTPQGASWVSPLEIQDCLLYVRSKGVGVNLLDFEQGREKYSVQDVTALARHFFEGFTIDDWAYANDPHQVAWLVRSDGKLVTLTFNRAQSVVAFALHDVGGIAESVVSVPEGTEDAVYVCVRRTINGATVRYLERFATRQVTTLSACIFLDASLTIAGAGASYTTLTGLGHLEGKSVKALIDGVVFGPFTVTAGAVTLPIATNITTAHVGLPITAQLETLDISDAKRDIRQLPTRVTEATLDVVSSQGIWAGESFARMTEARLRNVSDSYGAPTLATQQVEVRIGSTWNKGGRVCLEQREPLPLNVVGLSRKVDLGGD